MAKCLAYGVSLMIALLTCGSLASGENCADMEFEGLTQGEIVRVEEKTYINVTFYLNTSKCPENRKAFRIRVSVRSGDTSVTVCAIVINNTTCSVMDDSEDCQCLSDTEGWVPMFHLMNEKGLVTCTWRWRELNSNEIDKQTIIKFDVFSPATAAEPTSTPTDGGVDKPEVTSGAVTIKTSERVTPPGDEPKPEGDNFQVIFFTSVITALVIGVSLVTGIIIYVYRAKKKRKGNNNQHTNHIA